jgi:hypothetical protein
MYEVCRRGLSMLFWLGMLFYSYYLFWTVAVMQNDMTLVRHRMMSSASSWGRGEEGSAGPASLQALRLPDSVMRVALPPRVGDSSAREVEATEVLGRLRRQ